MTCHRNGAYLVDTCDPHIGPPIFSVDAGEAVTLQVCGDIGDLVLPLQQIIGSDTANCPVSVGGVALELSAATSYLAVTMPGTYEIDLSAVPEGACIRALAKEVTKEVAACVPTPFTVDKPCPQIVATGFVDEETCSPIIAIVECENGELVFPAQLGFITETGELQMAMRITPAGAVAPTCERADLLPLELVGPVGPFTYSELLTQAIAANPTDYPTFGPVLDTDTILELNAVEDNGGVFMLNGKDVGGVNDPDGVNLANTIEVPDGCVVSVTICTQQCQDKAGNVV